MVTKEETAMSHYLLVINTFYKFDSNYTKAEHKEALKSSMTLIEREISKIYIHKIETNICRRGYLPQTKNLEKMWSLKEFAM